MFANGDENLEQAGAEPQGHFLRISTALIQSFASMKIEHPSTSLGFN